MNVRLRFSNRDNCPRSIRSDDRKFVLAQCDETQLADILAGAMAKVAKVGMDAADMATVMASDDGGSNTLPDVVGEPELGIESEEGDADRRGVAKFDESGGLGLTWGKPGRKVLRG
jgi:hypothetical protein